MSNTAEINGKHADNHEGDHAQEWVVRLVPEQELRSTGRAAPTGVHLALYAPEVAGMSAWDLGRLWGYGEEELGEMIEEGAHFVAVIAPATPNLGRATAQSLAALIHSLRPDEAVHGSIDDFVEATQISVEDATRVGLRPAQQALARVFGLKDGAFGSGVIADGRRDDEDDGPSFVIDEKIGEGHPLEPGSSLLLEDYPGLPAVIRLPWDGEDEE